MYGEKTNSSAAFLIFKTFYWTLQVDCVDGKPDQVAKNVLPCTLDGATQNLIQLIFSNDMFKEAMECMNLGGCVSVAKHSVITHSLCLKCQLCNLPVGLKGAEFKSTPLY